MSCLRLRARMARASCNAIDILTPIFLPVFLSVIRDPLLWHRVVCRSVGGDVYFSFTKKTHWSN